MNTLLLKTEDFKPLLVPRSPASHKGSFPKVLVFAGSLNFPGAAHLTCLGALKAGAGYVYLDSEVASQVVTNLPEVIPQNIPHPSSLVLGPGLDNCDQFYKWSSLNAHSVPLILDASALNADTLEFLKTSPYQIVATPHPGETAALLGISPKAVQNDRSLALKALAQKYPWVKVWVLKGSQTLIMDEQCPYLNPTGNVAMATAGQGDVLSGILATLAASSENLSLAIRFGVFLHGLSADHLSQMSRLDRGVLPHEVAMNIPETFAHIREELFPHGS